MGAAGGKLYEAGNKGYDDILHRRAVTFEEFSKSPNLYVGNTYFIATEDRNIMKAQFRLSRNKAMIEWVEKNDKDTYDITIEDLQGKKSETVTATDLDGLLCFNDGKGKWSFFVRDADQNGGTRKRLTKKQKKRKTLKRYREIPY